MRVLVFTNMYPTIAEPWFGCFVKEQVDDLRAIGVEMDVLTFDGRVSKQAYARAALDLRRALRKRPYTLVHAHYGLTGAVALTQRQAPVLTTFHGTDAGHVAWKRRISWFVARGSTPIFVSGRAAQAVGLNPKRVIPAGVDVDLFTIGDRETARRELGLPLDATVILFPGQRGVAAKNAPLFDAVIEVLVARGVKAVPLTLAGFERSAVPTLYRASNALLMTSLSEGSPLAVREALACGTPVVSVDVGDVEEVIRGLSGCSIRSRDPEDLAGGVAETAHALPTALRARAEKFGRARAAEQIRDVYMEVAG